MARWWHVELSFTKAQSAQAALVVPPYLTNRPGFVGSVGSPPALGNSRHHYLVASYTTTMASSSPSSSPEISVVRTTSATSRSSSTDSYESESANADAAIVAPLSFTNAFLYTGDEFDGGMSPVAPQPSSPTQQGDDDCIPSRA